MEDNIQLFDNYILGRLSAQDEINFKSRLESDEDLARDFRIYLFTVRGIRQEEEQDCVEFATAIRNISKKELMDIIGRRKGPKIFRIAYLRERVSWAAAVIGVIIISAFAVFQVDRYGNNKLDNALVAYNYVPGDYLTSGVPRGESSQNMDLMSMSDSEIMAFIPRLQAQYKMIGEDDIAAAQNAGMRLAMAYLKLHDRTEARKILEQMTVRFNYDAEFVAKCNNIIEQIK